MADPTPDPATAALAGIRERWSKVEYVGLKPEVVPEPGEQPEWLPDVARLLAAVDAVLKLTDELTGPAVAADCLDEELIEVRRECGKRFREAITRDLTEGGGGNGS